MKKYAELRGNTQKHGIKNLCVNKLDVSLMTKQLNPAIDAFGQVSSSLGRSLGATFNTGVDSAINNLQKSVIGNCVAPLRSNPQMCIG